MKKLSLPIFIFFIFCKITLAQSSLPECKGNDVTNPIKKFIKSKKWNSCHGTMLTLKGNPAYIGEFNKGQPHGFGTFIYLVNSVCLECVLVVAESDSEITF